jgi:hypothetical protein
MGANYCSIKERPNYTFLGLAVFILIAVSSLGYFTETNAVASLGYEIKSHQKEIDKLNDENQRMKITIAEESSFKKISEDGSAEKMNLVSVTNQQYLTISSSSLASR